jgi:hypothetical protein
MDADYYTLTGQQLAQGRGFNEPVLWNYLDDPQGLPHPSHAYWLPLASLVAAASMKATGATTFAAGRVLFILLAAAIAPLSARLAFALTKQSCLALFVGGLAIVSAFYLPYLVTTDSFAISMLLGGFFFLIIIEAEKGKLSHLQTFGLGILAGLMHLARAEGLLWLLIAIWVVWLLSARKSDLLIVLAGYLLIMGPWLLRDWSVFGSVFAPGSARTLWLTTYNEFFAYPANQLTAVHWLSSGWGAILQTRFAALGQNLLSALSVQGLVFLAPLIVWGARKMRQQLSVRVGLVALAAILIIMSFAFPFSGPRGGFFHAAAALQPFTWALAAAGLQAFIEWGAARRNWQPHQALRVLGAGALIFALALSAYVVKVRVVGDELNSLAWNQSAEHYVEMGQVLDQIGVPTNEIIMVNNPPGFALATGRPAIVIPNGGVGVSLAAAMRYDARVLLLESNHPVDWDKIYNRPETVMGLSYVKTVAGTDVFFLP